MLRMSRLLLLRRPPLYLLAAPFGLLPLLGLSGVPASRWLCVLPWLCLLVPGCFLLCACRSPRKLLAILHFFALFLPYLLIGCFLLFLACVSLCHCATSVSGCVSHKYHAFTASYKIKNRTVKGLYPLRCDIWEQFKYRLWDSNPHSLGNSILSRARLPFRQAGACGGDVR